MFECVRCGYEHTNKNVMENHLNRKNKCKPLLCDVELTEDIKKNILIVPIIKKSEIKTCTGCDKSYSTHSSLIRHMNNCDIIKSKDQKDQKDIKSKDQKDQKDQKDIKSKNQKDIIPFIEDLLIILIKQLELIKNFKNII